MYVAITRAKNKLTLTNAKKRTLYGQEQASIPSRFINEIDSSLLHSLNKKEEHVIVRKTKNLYENDQEYTYGDKIEHDTYGIGVVIEVSNTILTVAFKNGIGIKKLMKNHKSIRKV